MYICAKFQLNRPSRSGKINPFVPPIFDFCNFLRFPKTLIKSEGINIFQIGLRQNSSNTFLYNISKIEQNLRTSIEQLCMYLGRGLRGVTLIHLQQEM